MNTRPIPPHGTPARYKGGALWKPCRCQPCRLGESRRAKRQRYLSATGQPVLVAVEPIAAHLELLRAGGASIQAVAAAAGCHPATLHLVLSDRHTRIRRDIADRIKAVDITHVIDGRRPVPSIGSSRRLQSLYAVGHGLNDIAKQTGLTRQFLAGVVSQHKPTIATESADRIHACWIALKDTEGTCTRNRNRAAREGWLRPDQWVDDDIDIPESNELVHVAPAELTRAACLAIARDLTLEGRTAEEIAARIGRSPRTVWRWQAQHDWKTAA